MHSSIHFFVFILLTCSYNQLSKPVIVEARNLASNGLTFSVDLIHRDSPMSPYYQSSMTSDETNLRSTLGSISSNHHFRLSSTFYNNKEDNSSSSSIGSTEVIPNGGDYLIKIAVGSPPVEFTAVADTGSNLVWVQCYPCNPCISQQSPFFNPANSSTYHALPCTNCNFPDLTTACVPNNNTNSCVYTAEYGDGLKSTGIIATDTFTMSSNGAFLSTVFGCGFSQKGSFGIQGDGIIGLGSGSNSLVSQLGPKINHKFSYCLTPLSSGVNGKLNFGKSVMGGPGVVSTPFIVSQDAPIFYHLTLDSISIENTSVPVGKDVIIDSGTTLTFLETSVYEGVRSAVKGAISLKTVPDPDQVFDPCYDASQQTGFNPPDVEFKFKGANVVLKAANTFRTKKNLTCFAMVPTDDRIIFGNIAQVNFEVGYDLQAKTVSFAPTDCTKY